MRDAMLVAFLTGLRHSRKGLIKASVFDDALSELSRLEGYDLDRLRDKYSDEVSKTFDDLALHAESKLNGRVADLIRDGAHAREATRALLEETDKLGLGPQKSWRLESMFRTQTAVAYGAGRWKGDQDPAIQEILWGYEYATAADDRVRPEHEALDGVKRPKDDPFWQRFWPPNGWNCRCVALPIYNDEEPKATPIPSETDGGDEVRPDPGFGFNAGELTPAQSPLGPTPQLQPLKPETVVSVPPESEPEPEPPPSPELTTEQLLERVERGLAENDELFAEAAISKAEWFAEKDRLEAERDRLRALLPKKSPEELNSQLLDVYAEIGRNDRAVSDARIDAKTYFAEKERLEARRDELLAQGAKLPKQNLAALGERAFDLPGSDELDPSAWFGAVEEWAASLDEDDNMVGPWIGAAYIDIRAAQMGLPNGNAAWLKQFKADVKDAPKYSGTVWRGVADVPKSFVDQFKPGSTYNLNAFSSASKSIDIAGGFKDSTRGESGHDILMRIRAKTGIDISTENLNPDEEEVVLRPGRYSVISVKQLASREWRVDLIEE